MNPYVQINPGGSLPPSQIVGRKGTIDRLFEALRTRSAALVAPRRLGKSQVLLKMEAEPAAGFVVRRYSLEELHSAGAFVEKVYREAEADVSAGTAVRRHADVVIRKLRGKVDVAGLAIELESGSWQHLLTAIFADLQAGALAQQRIVVLAWDEFTTFLDDLQTHERAKEAGQILAVLRTLRQSPEYNRVRMLYTGSIGLEEVVARLQQARVTREPLNDIHREVLPVLDAEGAFMLADGLVRSQVPEGDEALARAIAVAGEGHPLFLHHIARILHQGGQWRIDAVGPALESLLDDSQDPLELDAWADRIRLYRQDDSEAIERVLDVLSEGPASVDEVLARTRLDRGAVADLLRFLQRDLYTRREGDRHTFNLDLLRRFWRQYRGLA